MATTPYTLFVIINVVTIVMMIDGDDNDDDGDDDGDQIWGIWHSLQSVWCTSMRTRVQLSSTQVKSQSVAERTN